MMKKSISLILIVMLLAQCLAGCGSKKEQVSEDVYIPEETIDESFVDENKLSEDNISEALILENLKEEDYTYELTIDEDFYCESYVIEAVAGDDVIDSISSQMPPDIDNYDIDWPKVVGKFAAGTAIIITVGIVHHATKGATYYVFASPAKVAKNALVSGAMFAAIDVVKNCKSGKLPKEGLKKYSIEGFADGYMWGAICSVGDTVIRNLKLPAKLKLADGSKLKIKADGSVIDKAGKTIGNAFYSKDGIYVKNSVGEIPYLFNNKGKQLVDVSAELLSNMAKGRLPANTVLQLGLKDSAQTLRTDATGTVFMQNGKLLPNTTYQLGQNIYQTDSLGRIVKVQFENLELTTRKGRLGSVNSLDEIGRGFQKAGDDRGHLIGDRFNGDNSLANMVSMNSTLNRGEYEAMENAWADAIMNGDNVSGTMELTYSGSSFRPDEIEVAYSIGRRMVTRIFQNI